MLLKRNSLECLTIFSCSGAIICILLNCVTNISPITGAWFLAYIFVLFVVSVSFSFKFLQWLLHLNKPIRYDLDALVKEYPYFSSLCHVLPRPRKRRKEDCKEYDTNELSVITTVLERKLVSSWYVPHISQEIGFPFACKQMLDQMIGKCFQICNKIESKDVFVDVCAILISHLKEYKKAMKRLEKSPDSTIESLYKKSHCISNPDKKLSSAEHCSNILRVVLKELVPWELWDTPQSELLVRILAKKLDIFVDSTLANPAWLNEKLLSTLKGKEAEVSKKKENADLKDDIAKETKEEIVPETKSEKPTVESALTTLITKTTAPILQRAINEEFNDNLKPVESINIVEEVPAKSTEPVDIKSSPVLRQRRGRQGRNEVKIYDRIIEGSVKTWETDMDLQCISLGQDLLASLDGEITLSRLWGQDAEPDGSPNPPRVKSPQPLWFGEEDTIDLELTDTSPAERSPVRKELSPKPAELLKELQTTVHQAKTKIGDLQVPPTVNIDVPRKQYSGDEAAGMMEGLLDFGIAGLKKGLRLTGLGDDLQDKSPSQTQKEKNAERMSPPEGRHRPAAAEPREAITSSVVQQEDNGVNSVPPLLKQQRVISQDSVPSHIRTAPSPVGAPAESPEPEYEEAADLSTSIAKLRHLLQRADSSPRAEEAWWESQRPHSSRPIDTATLADEYDMNAERNTSPGQASNNMQRLDKLFQRTVTGVFNSIKTAVGGEGGVGGVGGEGAEGEPAPPSLTDWTYVTTSIELSVGGSVARAVGSRRALAHVDAALDSLRHLPPTAPARPDPPPDDLEEWCASCGAMWSAGSELAAAAPDRAPHAAHRLATLLLADMSEALLEAWLYDLSAWLRAQVFVTFERMADGADDARGHTTTPLDVEYTCRVVMEKLPSVLHVFGSDTLSRAVDLCVRSVSDAAVNRDVGFRLLDVIAIHFKKAAALRNPSFDHN